ncbi:hypothetical protein QFZ24_009902 [Streptomyces phaeochromogenes]|nr:hypothetical protein [Streptomyces phaeochromogenes]
MGPGSCPVPGPMRVDCLDQDLHRPPPCAAIADRLTFGGNLIQTGRLALVQARAAAQAAAG